MEVCDMATEDVSVKLSPDQALVLYEWLVRANATETTNTEDQAEQRVLWDLEATLESQLTAPFNPDYRERLEAARARIRDPGS
jgi:hypothetical protein